MKLPNFNTENKTLCDIFMSGLTYHIPRFQRNYSWTSSQWEHIWGNVLSLLEQDASAVHYMGLLAIHEKDEKSFNVLDGQQRLTTICLIALAIIKNLQKLSVSDQEQDINAQHIKLVKERYFEDMDPVTLAIRPRLTLNSNDNYYFQNFLVPLAHLPQHGFLASERLLREALEWFDKQIASYLETSTMNLGLALAQLAEVMSNRLFFTVITVQDEQQAYQIFETLNARNIDLPATDILKNYLFPILESEYTSESEMGSLDIRWGIMLERLHSENFPDYLKVYWNSFYDFTNSSDLFKTIRAQIFTKSAAWQLFTDLENNLNNYLALISPNSSWSEEDKQCLDILKTLDSKYPLSLLLAAKSKWDSADFTQLLHAVVVITLRYNVICDFGTIGQEHIYNEVAQRISRGDCTNFNLALPTLSRIYPGDDIFRALFSEKTFITTDAHNRRVVRLILCSLEKHLSGKDYNPASDAFLIEHVLPQNTRENWGGFSNYEASYMHCRLGNMTLMPSGFNRNAHPEEYSAKRSYYNKSNFAITREIAHENTKWSPGRIAMRQHRMANQATSIWRIEQLS
jgi:uncharacterized protein with ParB-like and HNH nuclease domain